MLAQAHELVIKAKEADINLNRIVTLDTPDEELMAEGELGVILEWLIHDKDGNLVPERSGKKKSESFVRQFIECLYIHMDLVSSLWGYEVKNTDGYYRTLVPVGRSFDTTALISEDQFGTVVGTDNTAPTINDYALGTQIAHGTGVGQVQYGNEAYGLPTSTAAISSFTVVRAFSNVSGGTITVNEVGLYVRWATLSGPNSYNVMGFSYFMTIRDVIAGGVNLLDGETLTINYRFQGAI